MQGERKYPSGSSSQVMWQNSAVQTGKEMEEAPCLPCVPMGDEQVNTGWWKMKKNMDKSVVGKAWEDWLAWHPCTQCSERSWEKRSPESRTLCQEDVFLKGHMKTLRIQKEERHSWGGAETHEFPGKSLLYNCNAFSWQRCHLWHLPCLQRQPLTAGLRGF